MAGVRATRHETDENYCVQEMPMPSLGETLPHKRAIQSRRKKKGDYDQVVAVLTAVADYGNIEASKRACVVERRRA